MIVLAVAVLLLAVSNVLLAYLMVQHLAWHRTSAERRLERLEVTREAWERLYPGAKR